MDKWFSLIKDMITLAMFIGGFDVLIWKWLDAWEKRRTAPIRQMENEIKELKKCCDEHAGEMKELKAAGANTLEIVLGWFKK